MYFFADEARIRLYKLASFTTSELTAFYAKDISQTGNKIMKTYSSNVATAGKWIYCRVAYSQFRKKFYAFYQLNSLGVESHSTDGELPLEDVSLLYRTVTNQAVYNIPDNFISYQNQTEFILRQQNLTKNPYFRNINVYSDYIPINMDLRHIDFMTPFLTTYPPYLAFSTDLARYRRGFEKLEYLYYDEATKTHKKNLIDWKMRKSTVSGVTITMQKDLTVPDLPLCNPKTDAINSTKQRCDALSTTNGKCFNNGSGTATGNLCSSDTTVLSCGSGYNLDTSSFTCYTTQNYCTDLFIKTPGQSEPGICSYNCMSTQNHYTKTCGSGNKFAMNTTYKNNLACVTSTTSTDYFNLNYKCFENNETNSTQSVYYY